MSKPKYIVGIDLGTTNCVLAYTDYNIAETDELKINLFTIPQVIGPGETKEKSVLPSFLILPGPHEVPEGGLSLPWNKKMDFAVGEYARDRGMEIPNRLISSAKSWLCHNGVDRTEQILPWKCGEDARRISPLEASAIVKPSDFSTMPNVRRIFFSSSMIKIRALITSPRKDFAAGRW